MGKRISEVLKEKYKDTELNCDEALKLKSNLKKILISNKKDLAANC